MWLYGYPLCGGLSFCCWLLTSGLWCTLVAPWAVLPWAVWVLVMWAIVVGVARCCVFPHAAGGVVHVCSQRSFFPVLVAWLVVNLVWPLVMLPAHRWLYGCWPFWVTP